ncbi:MAG: death domain-containing protein [Proteobacteria bacterium]|nr:death domain-containing protein [Pseudomonadota bacterium]
MKLNQCEETIAQQSRPSLKRIQRRVERIERHLKKQNQQAKLELSAKNCLKFLLPVAKHWHNIGILLGIDPDLTLEQIEADYPDDCQQCVREMIKSWLKQVDPPPSWKDLAEAVREFNPSLAKKIVDCATTACRATDFNSQSSTFVQPL